MACGSGAFALSLAQADPERYVTAVDFSPANIAKAKAAADTARAGARLLSLTGRVLVTAGVIVGVQWLVITHGQDSTLLWVVLGLPALFSAYTLTKALTVTAVDGPRRRGDRR